MADLKLQAIISVVNKASVPLKAINSDLNKLRSPLRGLSRQLKGLDRASGFKELRKGVSGLAGEMGKLALISAGAATAGFVALNKMAEAGDEIIKTSTNFDISTDALQEWRFVAERSGVSVATMNKSMQAFTKRLAEARNGTGEMHGLLSKVNPQFLEQILAVDNNADAYALMIKQMAKLPDQQRQILLGDKAFSEAGRELVKVTAQGSEEIDRLRKSAHEYGAVLDRGVLEQSAEFQDEMTNIGSAVKGIAFAIGAELLPEVKNLMIDLREWYLLNKDLVKVEVGEFARNAANGIKEFAQWVKDVSPAVLNFVDSIGGFKTVAIGLGLVLAGPLLSAIVTLGAALTATPLGLFILGVTALTKLGLLLYDNFEPFRILINEISDGFALLIKLGKAVGGAVGGFFGVSAGSQKRPVASRRSRQQSSRPNLLAAQSSQQNTQVGGLIKVQIDSQAPVKIKTIQSDNANVPIDVDSGLSMAAL